MTSGINNTTNACLLPPSAPECALEKEHLDAFYNAGDFTSGKRFQRFVKTAEEQVGSFFIRLYGLSANHAPEIVLHTELMYILWTEMKYLTQDDDKSQRLLFKVLKSRKVREVRSGYELSRCVRRNAFSVYTAVYGPADKNNTKAWVPYINNISKVANDEDMLEDAYRSSLSGACFDYILDRTIDRGLETGTWLAQLKTLSDRDCLSLFLHICERFMRAIEEKALVLTWNRNAGILGLRRETARLVKENNALQEKTAGLEKDIQSRDAEILRLRKENQSLREEKRTADLEDALSAQLERALRKQKTEYEELEKKYGLLQEFADGLQDSIKEDAEQAEDNGGSVPFGELMQDDVLRNLRIVFVRDKETKDYVMMRRLSEVFPRAKFTNGVSSDINVRTTDLIVPLTAYTKHWSYWIGTGVAKKQSVPYMPIKYANVERIVRMIADRTKQEQT